MKPYERLQRHWCDTGARIITTEQSEEIVRNLEQKYSITLPDDFREYLGLCCPKDDHCYDEEISWWPMDRIKNIVEEYKHEVTERTIAQHAEKYIFFADYAIWCWAWAIACGKDENWGRVVVISGRDRFVADSFSEFVDRYIDDPRQLL